MAVNLARRPAADRSAEFSVQTAAVHSGGISLLSVGFSVLIAGLFSALDERPRLINLRSGQRRTRLARFLLLLLQRQQDLVQPQQDIGRDQMWRGRVPLDLQQWQARSTFLPEAAIVRVLSALMRRAGHRNVRSTSISLKNSP
jgi:hypothetical protein